MPLNFRAAGVHRAALLGAILLAPAIAVGQAPANMDAVIPPGQEDLIADMLGRGTTLPGECRFAGGHTKGSTIYATYDCANGKIEVELRHAGGASSAATQTGQFAIVVPNGLAKRLLHSGIRPPRGFVDSLASRIRSREAGFRWVWLPRRSRLEAALLVAVVVLPCAAGVVGGVILAGIWRQRRRRPAALHGHRTIPPLTAAAAIRVAGLSGIVLIACAGAATRAGPWSENLAVCFGTMSIVAFLWLTMSGFFGYASASRHDWIGLVPFLIALVVREMLTTHSLQEIEVQFSEAPVGRHSLVYPLVQMFFLPIVRDPQSFTMHMNGVLGALASLAIYLFVRQRLDNRSAGFLCALFLAVHPVVARFSPTDGPYSLLLFAWFSALALLSAPEIHPKALFGGVVLLGLAATARMEGALFIPASLLMLDPQIFLTAIRRYRLVATCSLLVLAALGALQMYFLLPFHLHNGSLMPTRGSATLSLLSDGVVSTLSYGGPLFVALVLIGATSVVVTRQWLGLLTFAAMVLVIIPVADSSSPVTLHRLVPASALQAIVAGIGAYSTAAWMRTSHKRHWLPALPGVLAALVIFVQYRAELTKPYVFTEEYDLVRRYFAAGRMPADCELMTFNASIASDVDIHDFAPVVPGMRVRDCSRGDCVAELSNSGCFYYVRSVAAYYHPAGIPVACAAAGSMQGGDRVACMNEASAAFEKAVDLEPVDIRLVDILPTFEDRKHYPEKAEIGLFRVRSKNPASSSSGCQPRTRVASPDKIHDSVLLAPVNLAS